MNRSNAIFRNLRIDLDQSYQILTTIPLWVRILVPVLYVLSIPVETSWGFYYDTTGIRLSVAAFLMVFAFQKLWPKNAVRNGATLWFVQFTLSLPFTYGAILILNSAATPVGETLNILPLTEYSLCLFFMIQLQRALVLTIGSWLIGSSLAFLLLLFMDNPNMDLVFQSVAYALPFVITVFTLGGILHNALSEYQTDKEESIWRIATSIAHQLRTPLASVQNLSKGIALSYDSLTRGYTLAREAGLDVEEISDSRLRQIQTAFRDIGKESESAMTLISILIANSRPLHSTGDRKKIVHADKVVAQAIDTFPYNSPMERSLVSSTGEDFTVLVNQHLFLHVLYNLIANAVEFAQKEKGGKIQIATQSGLRSNTIKVRDTGSGIPSKYLDKVFDPFFSRNSMNGTGIGLPFCKSVIEDIGGQISVKSIEHEFTEFTIKLPKPNQLPLKQ